MLNIFAILFIIGSVSAEKYNAGVFRGWSGSDTTSRSLLSNAAERIMIINNTAIPAWRGRIDTKYGTGYFAPAVRVFPCNKATQTCNAATNTSLTYPYNQVLIDPTNPASNKPVLQAIYPAGSWSPTAQVPGGALLYAFPYKNTDKDVLDPFSQTGASLSYDVYFPPGFEWVKGGKLPGLTGGKSNGIGCGGGVDPAECFSFRVMWRRNGLGEAYIYVPHYMQAADFCSLPQCTYNANTPVPCTLCDYNAGVSFYRGSFTFQTGVWTNLRLYMRLNTPNVTDGVLQLYVNNELKIDYRSINWRQYPDKFIEGVYFATWYGGSDSTWAPTNQQYTLFRNIKMYYDGPTDTFGRASARRPDGPQYVDRTPWIEAP